MKKLNFHFKYQLSIKSVPTIELLEFLSRQTTDLSEKTKMENLSKDYNAYNLWRKGWPGLIDLLKEFSSIRVDSAAKLPSADLASRLPILQPRFYSIASSYDYMQANCDAGSILVDLLVQVVEHEGPDGAMRK